MNNSSFLPLVLQDLRRNRVSFHNWAKPADTLPQTRFLLGACVSFVLISLLLPSNSALATVITSAFLQQKPLETCPNSQTQFTQNSIQIVDDKIILGENLQSELSGEIAKAKKELSELSKKLSIKFDDNIGIVYLHQGQDNWMVNFTFGGVILNTSEKITFSTREVFTLKERFEQIKWIEIKEQKYATTGDMRQIGPILHSDTHATSR